MFSIQEYSFDAATQGLLSFNALQIAAQGLLNVKVEIDIIDTKDTPNINYHALPPVIQFKKKDKKYLKKRIKVTVNYNGEDFIEYGYTNNLAVTINQVKIEPIIESTTNKVNITIKIIP